MNLLIVSNQTIKAKMAGPAIRYFNIYNSFKNLYNCKLMSPRYKDINNDKNIIKLNIWSFIKELKSSDIIVSQPSRFKYLLLSRLLNKKIVIDLYDPMDIENLEMYKESNNFKTRMKLMYTHLRLKFSIMIGDYFLCANEIQRDYWIGYLCGLERVNKKNYEINDKLENLIGYMPYGINASVPTKSNNVLRGVVKGINKDDIILIWAGGIWNWFDTKNLIKAMNLISKENDKVKLVFLGVPSDYKENEKFKKVRETIELSNELDLTGKSIFFNMDWVDYDKRHNFLLESDIGISTHFDHMETRFSFRTRILDYLWVDLPFLSSDNDFFANFSKKNKLGYVAKCNDYIDIYNGIKYLLDVETRKKCSINIAKHKEVFLWENCFKDLKKFCDNPYKTYGKIGRIRSVIFVFKSMLKVISSILIKE